MSGVGTRETVAQVDLDHVWQDARRDADCFVVRLITEWGWSPQTVRAEAHRISDSRADLVESRFRRLGLSANASRALGSGSIIAFEHRLNKLCEAARLGAAQ